MAEFIGAGKASEVQPGQLKQIELPDGTQVCLANVDGKHYAIGGECTHQGGPLGEGELDGTIVTCPWHGGRFDVTTGAVEGPPPSEPEPSYEARVSGDDIEVAV